MNKEDVIELARKAGFQVGPSRDGPDDVWGVVANLDRLAKLIAEKERERIKEQNAPEIEKTNAYIKQLELEKMESDILHNEHRKLLGEIKAMTEAARSAEREECAKVCENEYIDFDWAHVEQHAAEICAEAIRARGQE